MCYLAPLRNLSLATRLALLYALSAYGLLILATGLLYATLSIGLHNEDTQYLLEETQVVRLLLAQEPIDSALIKQEVEWEGAQKLSHIYMRVLNAQGRIMLETPGMSTLVGGHLFPPLKDHLQDVSKMVDVSVDGKHLRLFTSRSRDAVGREYSIQAALNRTAEAELLARYRDLVFSVLSIGILFSAVLGYIVARRGLKPLAEITRMIQQVKASHLRQHVSAHHWPSELRVLAATFDGMLERLEASFSRLSRFSADLAHELRTPLNNLRGEGEVALTRARSLEEYRQVIESSLEEYVRLTRLIDGLLFLARTDEATLALCPSIFQVGDEFQVIHAFFEAAAEEQHVTIECVGDARLSADRLLFQQAVGNLVSNALRYTTAGGHIRLITHADDAAVTVVVADDGRGIAPEHLAHVFDRFYRADPGQPPSQTGVGLGLAIVKSIMTLHGGTAAIESTLHGGTTVTLSFPKLHRPR